MSSGKPAETVKTDQSSTQNSNTTGNTNMTTTGFTGGTSTNTSSTALPDWQADAWKNLASSASSAASTAGTPIGMPSGVSGAADYSSGLIGSMLPGVQNSFANGSSNILNQQVDADDIASKISSGDPYAKILSDPNSSWNSSTASSYMSPYMDTAAKARHALATDQLNQELSGVDTNFAASDALGGDRNAVERANMTKNANLAMAADDASAANDAYNSGLSAFNADKSRELTAAGGSAGVQQNAIQDLLAGKSNNVNANFASGQNTSAGIGVINSILSGASGLGTAQYQLGKDQSMQPLTALQGEASILSGAPNQSTVTNTSTDQKLTSGNTQGTQDSTTNASGQSNGQQDIYKNTNPFMQGLGGLMSLGSLFFKEGGIVESKKAARKRSKTVAKKKSKKQAKK